MSQGGVSLIDALKVGVAIEEIDILDLQTHLAQTDHMDIELVYENLLKGSRNHLRAFTFILQRQAGEVYVPQHLDVTSYNAIVGSSSGGNGRRWGNK